MSSVHDIPEKIYNEYNALTSHSKFNRYYNDKKNSFEDFINVISPEINAISKTKLDILEIGTNPILISEISDSTEKNLHIDGINFDEVNHNNSRSFNAKSKIYENLFLEDRGDFSAISNKYDVIVSFDSISYSVNITKPLKEIKSKLSEGGMLFLLIPKGDLTKLDASKNSFIYDEKFIQNQLKLAEFETTSITTVILAKQNEYFIIVAK